MIAVVLVTGYSLYGGLFFAAGAVHSSLADAAGPPETDVLEDSPDRPTGPNASAFRFREANAGMDYSYRSTDQFFYEEMISNAGVFAADYNTDGWTDVLAVGGKRPVLFENANGTFEQSGALPPIEGTVDAALWIDYNVDGRPDLVVLREESPPLLLENVEESFEKRSSVFEESLSHPYGATTADYDRDGCPDLFVYQNGNWSGGLPTGFENYSAPLNDDNGHQNVLYEGTCSGFTRVESSAIRGERWTLAATFVDFNGDGRPDIHTANDFNQDIVYLNRGNGTFRQHPLGETTNRNGMASEVADVSRNGRLDVFVSNIYYPEWAAERINPNIVSKSRGNTMIVNQGDGAFTDQTEDYGVAKGGWGWAAVVADFDNDGYQDLFHATQHMTFENRRLVFQPEEIDRLQENTYYSFPAVWKRIDGDSAFARHRNRLFSRVDPEEAGFTPADGHGVASLDYDNDGDVDLVVATTDEYRVYENRVNRTSAVQVRVLGEDGSQTAAHGATVTVVAGNQTRRVQSRTDFLSQDSRLIHVGVGNRTRVDVRVVWPDGTERVFEGVPANRRITVTPSGIRETVDLSGS